MERPDGLMGFQGLSHKDPAGGDKSGSFRDEFSRPLLFLIIIAAFAAGYVLHTRANKPVRVIKASVEKTLKAGYSASIEGNDSIGDSLLAEFRIRESFTPGAGISTVFAPEDSAPPANSLQLIEQLRAVTNAKELKREDMYGHPARHFYGDFPGGIGKTGVSTSVFEYWVD